MISFTSKLTVMDNLISVVGELQSCDADFIKLVAKDADSIPVLQTALETYDMDLSTKMEGQ